MQIQARLIPKVLKFRHPAGTSRGTYYQRKVWYIELVSKEFPKRGGIGEIAPLPLLSRELNNNYQKEIEEYCKRISNLDIVSLKDLIATELSNKPSLLFGIETALRHLEMQTFCLWDTPFSQGEEGIVINGLIWMGERRDMFDQIKTKIEQGYRCIKLKIGAIDFQEELSLLSYIRQHFSKSDIELRVDANGAFTQDNVIERLEALSEMDLHSIEQPIAPNQKGLMHLLSQKSPIAIALDEELIGYNTLEEKAKLLDELTPQFIVLKPSLHGGFSGCCDWIKLAKTRGIGYWITSALESNIGLNAIAQWCATLDTSMPQGLGTGQLFVDNIAMPLTIEGDKLWYRE